MWLEHSKQKIAAILYNLFTNVLSILVNKQLADKERVAAALENTHLIEVVNQCISNIKT